MTAAGSQNHIAIVISAEDRASKKVQTLAQSLRRNLGASLRSAALSMISFTAVLSAVGLSITGVAMMVKNWIGEVRDSNRAMAIMQTRLELSGHSADRAAAAIERYRNNLSRTAQAALPGLSAAVADFVASLGQGGLKDLIGQGEILAKMFGVDLTTAVEALGQAYKFGNFAEFNKITGLQIQSLEELERAVALMAKNYEASLTPLEKMWMSFTGALGKMGDALITFVNEKMQLLIDVFSPLLAAWQEKDWVEFAFVGARIAQAIFLGLMQWVLGDEAIKFIQSMFQLNLMGVLKGIGKFLAWVGTSIANMIANAILAFVLGPFVILFGDTIKEALGTFLGNVLPKFFQGGYEMAKNLAQGLVDGLKRFLQQAADTAINWVNEIIAKLNQAPFVNIPKVGGISLGPAPVFSNDRVPTATPQPTSGLMANQTITIPVNIGNRKIETIILEVLNGQVRVREPGLGMV